VFSIAGVRAHDTNVSVLFAGSRYIYDLYYEKEAISKTLYDWLLKNNYADAMLIAKWKKQGYEKVSYTRRRTACNGTLICYFSQ
jgi:bud site selection protein 31